MKSKIVLSALCAVLALAFVSPGPAMAADVFKIGIVNLQRLLNESDFGKQAKSSIEETYKQKEAQIDAKAKEKDKLAKDLEKQGMALSDDERKKRIDEIEAMDRDLQHMVSDAENYMQKIDRQKKEEFVKVIDKLIGNYGKGEGYTMILPSDSVIYSVEGMDITDKIMDLFNEAFKQKPVEKDKQKGK